LVLNANDQAEDLMKIRIGLVASVLALGAVSLAFAAQDDIIKMRQRLMDANGQAAKVAVSMIRGDLPFDAVIAAAVVSSISHDNSVFPDLFPKGSDQGETKAGPEIFAKNADFRALSAKMAKDAQAAAEAAAKGKDAFAAAFQVVGQNCQACHETYRKS
jgi:cytochrome c556